MKTVKTLFIALLIAVISPVSAQTADEIIDNYFENTGGKANWEKIESIKRDGVMKMQGMEIPITIVMNKEGKTYTEIDLQGTKMIWTAFDGTTLWEVNQMTMLPEESDNEATQNFKNELKDFPSPFLNYKEKGYSIELLGKEIIEGTEAYKIQLTKDPSIANGEEIENKPIYYFEVENFVPIIQETKIPFGPMAGTEVKITFSDYEEVDGLYFAFSEGSEFQTVEYKEITVNSEIDETKLKMPGKE